MARRVGAEMLAHLDRQSEAGLLAKPEYEAKRTEVLEMIRTGRDVDMTGGERFGRIVLGFVVAIVVWLIGGLTAMHLARGFIAWLGNIGFLILGVFLGARVSHPRFK